MAFKKILNVKRSESSTAYDEQTLMKIQTMDKILEGILSSLQSIHTSVKDLKESPEFSIILEYFSNILEDQLYPVLQHFN